MPPTDPTHPLSDAERAVAELLRERPDATRAELESACAERPELAEEMRRVYASWTEAETVGNDGTFPAGWLTGMLQRYGEGGASEDLPRAAPRAPESDEELLQRLSGDHRPAQRYTQREQIARGGMGAIFKVWDKDLRRSLAMKTTRRSKGASDAPDRDSLLRFLEEAQITGQLDHPSVVPVHELGVDADGRVFFTMRLVRGRDFKGIVPLVREGAEGWSLTRAMNVLLRACEAVAYAHSKGVIHRDLKPANIMVGRFGEVYVMDWGLARVLTRADRHDLRPDRRDPDLSSLRRSVRIETDRASLRDSSPDQALVTMDGTVIGTPCFMPPEQARGETESLGPRSDVYSLGAILYNVLTGTMPYVPPGKRIGAQLILVALINGPPKPVRELAPDAPEELVAICEKAMAHEAEDRYASAVELAADIQAYLEHRPVAARHHTLREVARLAYERNRPVVLTAAVATVLLLVAVSVFVWRQYLTVQDLEAANVEIAQTSEERDRTAAALSAQALLQQFDELTITPEDVGRMDSWLALVANVVGHADALKAQQAALIDEPGRADDVGRALQDIERLRQLAGRVEAWRSVAASLAARPDGEDAAAWKEACASIARSRLYGERNLRPQVGLAPLRENPNTGLWEFWLVASGERPLVDDWDDRRYALEPESGIVLVLLPPGHFRMGDEAPIYTTRREYKEADVPWMFIGMHEVTQAQWSRIMGRNDAYYSAGWTLPLLLAVGHEPAPITLLHPIESIDWNEAQRFARRLGVGLPHEVYWEYACRAGTETHWYWGDSPLDLEGMENLFGLEAEHVLPEGAKSVPWNDGYALHAPVGTFEPNAFGLFDMHGNVSEWCDQILPRHDGNKPETRSEAFYRGGSWSDFAEQASSAFPYDRMTDEIFSRVGLRVWRRVDE